MVEVVVTGRLKYVATQKKIMNLAYELFKWRYKVFVSYIKWKSFHFSSEKYNKFHTLIVA